MQRKMGGILVPEMGWGPLAAAGEEGENEGAEKVRTGKEEQAARENGNAKDS
jgi:hypothetical protein